MDLALAYTVFNYEKDNWKKIGPQIKLSILEK